MAKKSDDGVIQFNPDNLKNLLDRVYLDGVINEALLKVNGGNAMIEAVDSSTSVFIHAVEPMKGCPDVKMGLAPISLLVKFLGGKGEFIFTANDKFLKVKKTGHGEVKVNLVEAEQISTSADPEKDVDKKLLAACKITASIEPAGVERCQYYCGLLNTSSVVLDVRKGKIVARGNPNDPQQFNTVLATLNKGQDDVETKVEVHSKFLNAVLGALKFGNETLGEPTLHMGMGESPVVVKQAGNIWALTPIT